MSSRFRAVFGLVVFALAMLTNARPALADARTEARAHFKKGMEAISAGKYDDGIAELEKAYEILPHPNVLYNIARAHAEAGNARQDHAGTSSTHITSLLVYMFFLTGPRDPG